MPGRKFSAGVGYRYGFNGKENENDVKVEGGQQDYGMRIYDPRLGKFLSVDPITAEYPWLTPYQFASNRPVDGIDRDGLEFEPYWATRVPEQIRKYEADLRKKDPANAEEIIRRKNINAALFVGGALTLGGGFGLKATLIRVMTSPQIITSVSSITAIASKYGPDVANFVYGAASGDSQEPVPTNTGSQSSDAGVAFRNLFKKGNVILDFFGGSASRFKNGISIDIAGNPSMGSFKGSVEQFAELFKGTKFKQIIAENPYGSYDYLKSASGLLEKGGTLTVRGSASNKFFNKLLNGNIEGLDNFTMQKPKLIEPVGYTTGGTKIESKEYYEIVLKKN